MAAELERLDASAGKATAAQRANSSLKDAAPERLPVGLITITALRRGLEAPCPPRFLMHILRNVASADT